MPIAVRVIDNFLYDFEEGFVSRLRLTITLWEVWDGKVMMDVEGSTQLFNVQIFKISSMVYEDGSWDVKAVNNVIEDEFGDLKSHGYDKGDYFNPLSKIFCGYYDPLMSF